MPGAVAVVEELQWEAPAWPCPARTPGKPWDEATLVSVWCSCEVFRKHGTLKANEQSHQQEMRSRHKETKAEGLFCV